MPQVDGEVWFEPVTLGREADPHTVAVWRFRVLVGLLTLAVVVLAVYGVLSVAGVFSSGDNGGGVG
jgi:hypothetical protein